MIYLLLSILCSVTVGVLFKITKRNQVNLYQAITWNYFFAIALSYFTLSPNMNELGIPSISSIHLILGFLLPTIFIVLAWSVRQAGLARTDVAQRLSLILSLCAAYFIFNEHFDPYKIIGVAIGFMAILFILNRRSEKSQKKQAWLYLLFVFVGFGVVDVLFKKLSQQASSSFPTSLLIIYSIAFIISIIYLTYLRFAKSQLFELRNFWTGCLLGLFNFGNMLFYLKAHKALAENPSTVFAAMNLGVITLGSIIGIFLFGEHFSKLNYVGLLLALIAVVFITLSKIYAF